MPEEPSAAETPRRSKRIYVLWGIALTLLVVTGVLCWTVVVPSYKVFKEVGELSGDYSHKSASTPRLAWVNPAAKPESLRTRGGEQGWQSLREPARPLQTSCPLWKMMVVGRRASEKPLRGNAQ
jgi:hypothetical protein